MLRIPSFRAALLATVLAAPVAALAQESDSAAAVALARNPAGVLPLDRRTTYGTLPNGMRYYVRANSRPEKRAELRLVVNVGSMQEDDDQRGLAHVLEHMAFNGTRRFAKQAIVDFIERAGMQFGADLNAGTSFDETVYMLQMPSDTGDYIGRGLEWFGDIASGGIMLDSLELEKERPVVIEEWRLGQGADERIQRQQIPVIFQASRYADRLPIGTRESLDSFTRSQVLRFYRDWYRPELMAVVAVGDFDADSVERLIRERFGPIPASPPGVRPRTASPLPGHAETLVAITTDLEISQSSVGILWKLSPRPTRTVGDYQRDLAAALFLSMLNQRFDEIVRQPDAPFVAAGASQGNLVRSSELFSLDAAVKEGGIVRGLTGALVEAERVRRHGFTTTEFERQKTAMLRSLDIQFNERDRTSSATYAVRYVNHALTGNPQLGIEFRAPLVRALLPNIAVADVNSLAARWMGDTSRVVLAVAPATPNATPTAPDLLGVIDDVRQQAIAAYDDAASNAPVVAEKPAPGRITNERRLDAIDVTEWTLSNGTKVLVKTTDFQRDQVFVSAISPGGVGNASPSEFQAALAAPQLLERGGVGTLDAVELRKLLTGKAAAISADISDRTEGVSGRASPQDLELLFELMWGKLRTPRLDTGAIRAMKQQMGAFLANRSNQPGTVYFDTITVTMTQNHPLARPITAELIESIDPQVALRLFNDRFADFSDFTFVIVGAVTTDELRPMVEQWVASLPGSGRVERPATIDIAPPTGAISKTVRRGVAPQAQSHIIMTGRAEWSPDAQLRTEAITEILTMRLREVLREDLGGTYGAGFSTAITRATGRFQTAINFGSAPERADSLGDAALDVVRKFVAEGPTQDELAKVRESLLRSREEDLKQNGFWASVLEDAALWGDNPASAIDGFTQRVERLDAASIQALARVVLSEANLARFRLLPERISQQP